MQVFLQALNDKTDAARQRHEEDGLKYRLPSEAQWEYAARGGKNQPEIRFAGSRNLKEVGWYDDNSHSETKPVGLKLPNELGLYDMSGNVDEWCADHWQDSLEGIPKDGRPRLLEGQKKAAWFVAGLGTTINNYCRVADRYRYDSNDRYDNIGFRLARY